MVTSNCSTLSFTQILQQSVPRSSRFQKFMEQGHGHGNMCLWCPLRDLTSGLSASYLSLPLGTLPKLFSLDDFLLVDDFIHPRLALNSRPLASASEVLHLHLCLPPLALFSQSKANMLMLIATQFLRAPRRNNPHYHKLTDGQNTFQQLKMKEVLAYVSR